MFLKQEKSEIDDFERRKNFGSKEKILRMQVFATKIKKFPREVYTHNTNFTFFSYK